MKRITGAFLLTAALITTLAACTTTPRPPDDAVEKWYAAQAEVKPAAGTHAVGTGAGYSDPSTRDRTGEGITFTETESPVTVTGFDVICFGATSIPFRYTVSGPKETTSIKTDAVVCDKRPHRLPFTAQGVTTITVNGLAAPSHTAWFATALGYATPTDGR